MAESSLEQLIGAVIAALVRADSHAAMATLDYMERVGFQPGEDGRLGALRMFTFEYERTSLDGITRTHVMRLPLLALVPIPSLQIEDCELSFDVNITGMEPSSMPGVLMNTDASPPAPVLMASLAPTTGPSSGPASSDQNAAATAKAEGGNDLTGSMMHVKINLRRGGLPGGMINLLGLMGGLNGTEGGSPGRVADDNESHTTSKGGFQAQNTAKLAGADDATPSRPMRPRPGESLADFNRRVQNRFSSQKDE